MGKLPGWTQPVLFALLTTAFASFMVSGISTYRAVGLVADFPRQWFGAWLWSCPVAFPALYLIAPVVRKFLSRICK